MSFSWLEQIGEMPHCIANGSLRNSEFLAKGGLADVALTVPPHDDSSLLYGKLLRSRSALRSRHGDTLPCLSGGKTTNGMDVDPIFIREGPARFAQDHPRA